MSTLQEIYNKIQLFDINYDPDTKYYEISSIPDDSVTLTTCPVRAEEILEELYENYSSRKST